MKRITFLLLQLTPLFLFSQFKTGEYKFVKDSSSMDVLSGSLFSKFQFVSNKTYNFEFLTTISCLLWQKSKGTWSIHKDTLILKDSIYASNPIIKEQTRIKTSDNKLIINLLDTLSNPIKGVMVKVFFRKTYDSLINYTNEQGSISIDTYNRKETKEKNLAFESNDVNIQMFNGKNEFISNELTYLSSINNFIVREKSEEGRIERTAYFLIKKKKIEFIKYMYSKVYEFNLGVHMLGNYQSE